MVRLSYRVSVCAIVGALAACAGGYREPYYPPAHDVPAVPAAPAAVALPTAVNATSPAIVQQPKSRWVAVPWSALPGFSQDTLFEAWNAWLRSCERPIPALASLCTDVRRLSIGSTEDKRAWMLERFQPYRVESLQGDPNGLLTGYFEPVLNATRTPDATHTVPLYQVPTGLGLRKPWFTRQEIDTLPEAQAALAGKTIAYLADPVEALILQIQGSGRIRVPLDDGRLHWVRLAYAATNDQPYRSVGRWLADQGLSRDTSWPGIRAWLAQNPTRQQELLWANPRVVFFKEEVLSDLDAAFGPKGAQGVALTPGRSIAVDPGSIPYGTPVWLASSGAQINFQKLVLTQDTGSAIIGAVRADYFVGWGESAGDLAGRLRQPLQLWALWPKEPR